MGGVCAGNGYYGRRVHPLCVRKRLEAERWLLKKQDENQSRGFPVVLALVILLVAHRVELKCT